MNSIRTAPQTVARLEAAMADWNAARLAYGNEPCKSRRDVYNKCTFELAVNREVASPAARIG
jgi:hypothetical protein